MKQTLTGLAAALALSLASSATFADVKPDAGDYQAAPPGTKLVVPYYQRHTADKLYNSGDKLTSDFDMTLDVGLLRYVHFTKLGDYIIDPQIIVPVGRQNVGLANARTSGLGDLIVGGTLWTVADFERGEFLGYSIFVTAPTGSDKNKGFALSQNRWALDFQLGYVKRLNSKWSVDVIGEIEFYADDRKTDAKRKPLLQIHNHLRYHLSDATHVAVSYRHNWGARDHLDGNTLSGSRDNGNLTLTWASYVQPGLQVQLQYSHDTHVRSGPLTHGIQTRLVKVF